MLNDLRTELSRLYPDTDSAKRIVSDAGLPGIFIDFDGAIIDIWYQAIRQAQIRNKLPDLVQAAMRDYPQSAILQRVYGSFLYGTAPGSDESAEIEISEMPDNETKIDKVYSLVFKTNERLAKVETWQMALAIALGVLALYVIVKGI